ncbi:MAG TPA: ABC transporter permease [Myxococcota bacterium]|nr:ABC transporter permease [Myxococcota bacterium]
MIAQAFHEALARLASFDPEVWDAVRVSLSVSGSATLAACAVGIPLGVGVALSRFPGKRAVVAGVNTLMSLPTVVIGLVLYALLSRSGPLGGLELLYTRAAMAVGQAVLATPIVAALAIGSLEQVDVRLRQTAWSLGATAGQARWVVVRESRGALVAAGMAAFGRVFAEVGVSMMLGGNLRGETRNLATGIAFETGKGEFAVGLALGFVLLTVALGVNALAILLKRAREDAP